MTKSDFKARKKSEAEIFRREAMIGKFNYCKAMQGEFSDDRMSARNGTKWKPNLIFNLTFLVSRNFSRAMFKLATRS